MTTLEIGYLFKKKIITYKSKEYEIFEFVDYIIGIVFTNRNNNERCNIISGIKTGEYASIIQKNSNELDDYIFIKDNLGQAIKDIDNSVDFDAIRKKRISDTAKYYLRSSNRTGVDKLVNKELLNFLNSSNNKSDFDEMCFEQNSDISNMYSFIKKTIISQDEQIMQILTALFKNQTIIKSNLDDDLITKLKENILICGSTGTGKTEILKRISKIYNIPIVIEDATSLSETGYHGRNITDMLEDLYLASDCNIDLAEKGILVIDEFDKLAEKETSIDTHVSRIGVQRSLLKLLDGTTFYFDDIKFNTSKLTVVALGAFTGITKDDTYNNLTTEDFKKYGIMRELMGRFSKIIAMNPLLKEDIVKILKNSEFSPLNTYQKLFEILDVKFEFNDEFIDYIAEKAISKNSGARSLKTVFDSCISSALFRIFAGEYSGISLIKPQNETDKAYILTKNK